jgi:sterol desaturase/sphingolipid hydroxylase (fatty acid hydroxylase superfamily)
LKKPLRKDAGSPPSLRPWLQVGVAALLVAGASVAAGAGRADWRAFLLSDPLLLMLAMIVLLGLVEAAAPGSPVPFGQRAFNASYGLTHQFAAFLIAAPLAAATAYAVRRLGSGWIDLRSLGFAGTAGELFAVAVSALVHDFFFYWFHRLEHASDFFWQPHLMHHTDANVNATTAARGHLLETILMPAFVAIPMTVLFALPPIKVGLLSLLPFAWLYVAHANVKLGFGPLWWAVVSPSYHRIHHSLEKRHFGKNYANWFPIWDVAFGTALRPTRAEWPRTGVADVEIDSILEAYVRPVRAWARMLLGRAGQAGAAVR